MATKGPSPELSSKLICQEWIADGLTKWKRKKTSYSLLLPSFLMFGYLGSKSGSLMSPFSKIILNIFFFFSELLSDSWILCLMRWGTEIKTAHRSSLGDGGGHPHVLHWQGWQNDRAPLMRPFWDKNISALLKGIHDLVNSLSQVN